MDRLGLPDKAPNNVEQSRGSSCLRVFVLIFWWDQSVGQRKIVRGRTLQRNPSLRRQVLLALPIQDFHFKEVVPADQPCRLEVIGFRRGSTRRDHPMVLEFPDHVPFDIGQSIPRKKVFRDVSSLGVTL